MGGEGQDMAVPEIYGGGKGQIYLVERRTVSTRRLLFHRSPSCGAWVVRANARARRQRWRAVPELLR